MPIPDPKPNGEPAANSDEFEMTLEPVDPAELNFDDAPMVEAVTPPQPGFGFWMGAAWSLAFFCATQVFPAIVLLIVYGPALSDRYAQIATDARNDPSQPADYPSILRKFVDSSEMRKFTQVGLITAPACGILFSLFFLRRVVGKEWQRRLAIRRPHLEHVVLILLLFFPIFIFNIAFESLTSRLPRWVDQFNMPGMKELTQSMLTWPAWVVTLGVAVGPAVSEELFCRGFLGHGLVRRFGTRLGVVLTSFFFGLIHLSLIQSVFAVGMGIVLHSIYLATRSLLAPILLHFLNNFFAVPAESESIPIYLGSSLQQAYEYRPVLMLTASALMVIVIGWAFSASRVRIFSTGGRESPDLRYRHVVLPPESSAQRAIKGPIPTVTAVALIAATGFFAAVWFGL